MASTSTAHVRMPPAEAVVRRAWRKNWGNGYTLDVKTREVSPLLHGLDRLGRLGSRILDIGSGSLIMQETARFGNSEIIMRDKGSFYPTQGKRIVRVDIGAPFLRRKQDGILELQADITKLEADSRAQIRRLAILADHLGFDARSELPRFDTMLLSDVLNYLDYRKVLSGLSRFLSPGGRMVIHNTPGKGWFRLFSDEQVRLKDNRALVSHLRSCDLVLEHLSAVSLLHANSSPSAYPSIDTPGSCDRITLVAVTR